MIPKIFALICKNYILLFGAKQCENGQKMDVIKVTIVSNRNTHHRTRTSLSESKPSYPYQYKVSTVLNKLRTHQVKIQGSLFIKTCYHR